MKYIPGDTESMRNALITYKNLIDSGEAFENSYCIAHFLPQEQGNITIFDYKNTLAGETLFFKYAVEILELKKDTSKTFCYCDNSDARKIMLGYNPYNSIEVNEKLFSPIQYLRENLKHFQEFKDILIERFKNMPYLQYTDDERYYDKNPLKNFMVNKYIYKQISRYIN